MGADPALTHELLTGGARHERLGPLSQLDVERLLEAASAPIDEPVVDALLSHSGGSPGLCARAVVSLASRGGASPEGIQKILSELELPPEAPTLPQLSRKDTLIEAQQALQEHAPSRAKRLVLSLTEGDGGVEAASILAGLTP